MIKGIIFDMDGVLVLGANEAHVRAWREALELHAISATVMDARHYGELEGARGEEILKAILKENHLTVSADLERAIYESKKTIFTRLDHPYTPQPVKRMIRKLHNQGYTLVLASGNNRTVIETFLARQHLRDVFDFTITGDDIEKGKPDPEIFLKAWQATSLPKQELVIVENAPYGIAAAKAAGIFTIAVATTLPRELLASADVVVDDTAQVGKYLSP